MAADDEDYVYDEESGEWLPASEPWPEMPRRLQAVRGDARVRVVVDGWEPAR